MCLGDNMTSPMYGVGANGGLSIIGGYDPGITEEVDAQIRNLPEVVQYCYQKAVELMRATGSENFEVLLSTREGAEVSHAGHVALSNRKPMSRKLVFDRSSGSWGSGMGSTNHGREHQRPRAYVMPANGKGIHEELEDGVLLKAALGMAGK